MELEVNIKLVLLVVLIIFGIYACIMAFKTQLLGEDEGLYIELERELAKGNFPAYLRDKPMALVFGKSLFTAIAFILFGVTLSVAKAVVCLFGLATLILIFFIGEKINPDDEFNIIGFSSAMLLISAPLFCNFLLIAYTDIPVVFFSALTFYLLLLPDSNKKYAILGAVTGFSYFVKQSGLLLIVFTLSYLVYKFIKSKNRDYLKYLLIAGTIAGLVLAPWIIRNIILYKYPYFEILNPFFTAPKGETPVWLTPDIQKQINPKIDYLSIMPVITMGIVSMGIIYFAFTRDKRFIMPLTMAMLFIVFFIVLGSSGYRVIEDRYYLLAFPQLALIGGIFLSELKKENKLLLIPITLVCLYFLFVGYTAITNISNAQRYPAYYIDSLNWIYKNSNSTDKVFTAYSGSVRVYADRSTVWNIDEFPELMETDNTTRMYEILSKYNVRYVVIWGGILSPNDEWIIPQANLFGVFTQKFFRNIQTDSEHFKVAYNNGNSVVFEVISNCSKNELGVCNV